MQALAIWSWVEPGVVLVGAGLNRSRLASLFLKDEIYVLSKSIPRACSVYKALLNLCTLCLYQSYDAAFPCMMLKLVQLVVYAGLLDSP